MHKLAGRDLEFVAKNTICYTIMNYQNTLFRYNLVFKLASDVSGETLTLLFSNEGGDCKIAFRG